MQGDQPFNALEASCVNVTSNISHHIKPHSSFVLLTPDHPPKQPSTTRNPDSTPLHIINHGLRKVPEAQQDGPRDARRQEEERDVLWLARLLVSIRREEVSHPWPDGHFKGMVN